jgi:Tfp pilus assembly protein FimT
MTPKTSAPHTARPPVERDTLARRAMRGSRAGVSLIELVLILVIMGILASIALPRLDLGRMTVDAAAGTMTMTMLGAQRIAIQEQHNVVVAFDTVAGTMRVHRDRNNDGVLDPGERTETVRLEDGVRYGRGTAPARAIGGRAVTFTRVQGALPALTFHRSGSASEIGGFYMTSVGRGDTRAFEVERSTGRTIRYEYDGSSWQRWF